MLSAVPIRQRRSLGRKTMGTSARSLALILALLLASASASLADTISVSTNGDEPALVELGTGVTADHLASAPTQVKSRATVRIKGPFKNGDSLILVRKAVPTSSPAIPASICTKEAWSGEKTIDLK